MLFLAALVLAQVGLGIDRTLPSPAPKPVSCGAAADPAIESATQEKTDSHAGVDTFLIHVSVLNRGTLAQNPKARQIVAVYYQDERIARVSVPPLGTGEAFAFTTRFRRASDAGANSTTLLFRLGGETYAPLSAQDCNEANDSFRLTF